MSLRRAFEGRGGAGVAEGEVGGLEREFGALSVGTGEQIALVLRLAIAEALPRRPARRMAWTRRLLVQAAQASQVIVLTCHPLDYEAESPDRVVDLSTLLARSD